MSSSRIRTFFVLLLVGLLSLTMVSCAGQKRADSVELSPEKLGRIGAKITRSPDSKPAILSKHGLTPEEFTRAIRNISSDVELSRRYHEAFRNALDEQKDPSA